MAESVVTFVLENVSALLIEEAHLLFGVREEVKSLHTELSIVVIPTLQHSIFLVRMQMRNAKRNGRVKLWVSQIRDEAYNVEDVIDLFVLKEERQRRRNMALKIIGYPNRLLNIHLVAKQIQDIKKRLKGISANAETYGLNKQSGESSSASLNQVLLLVKENRAPMVEEADVVGFHRDAEKLATLLVGGEARQNHSVSCPTELEELGKKIVGKCGGLPLAIVVLGGLLCTKAKTHGAWFKVVQSANWVLNQDTNRCAEVLALSYADLPYYLKSCFLYFGLFPEDAEISADRLIRLWIAEGFVQQRGEEMMEDVAEDYLEVLIHRSLIQVGRKRSDGGVKTCRIHDLLRDLAISEGKQDKFLDICAEPASRRLALLPVANGMLYPTTSSRLNLHSLLCFLSTKIDLWKSFWPFWGRIKLLRVLDLEYVPIHHLPKEIGVLLLLKFLGLAGTRIRSLPPSICNLRNLQTLDLQSNDISDIPNRLWKLKQLRHLYLSNTMVSSSSLWSWRIDNLSHLQTLELPAGNWIMGGLDKLMDLRQLSIEGSEILTVYKEALANSLPKLYSLRSLSLEGFLPTQAASFLPLVSFSQHIHLYRLYLSGQLEKLPNLVDFPPNLTELTLYGSGLAIGRQQEDEDAPQPQNQIMATLEQLPNLRVLFLGQGSYEEKEMIFTEGGFPKLQDLHIDDLENLEEWRVEKGATPCLQSLYLDSCDRLKMLPDGLRHVTTLQKFFLDQPNNPGLKARVEKDRGEDWYKIQHIPSITIW
ncbi:hypothetical protein HHK36_014512 [Tetracentron sinense]|uniref:Uncharacterized protein n=1 Tax=Tetracentron sinense TaxID=13715 RepID=A0A835DFC1_TETSI|nr:hypothetical protein HHK36_014512 [Tetracentron sinense]